MLRRNCALLIDDDNISNYLNKKIVDQLNVSNETYVALNGLEALDFIANYSANSGECPELILLDINMPLMNGLEFLKEYHKLSFKNRGKVSVIVLTTSTHSSDIAEIKKYNISGILNKPLTLERLQNLLE